VRDELSYAKRRRNEEDDCEYTELPKDYFDGQAAAER
jgi:hypothetical protein